MDIQHRITGEVFFVTDTVVDWVDLSSHYLSDLLKKETGKNTLEQIHYYLIEKAKMNLLNSFDSISQIAYELGFEYPQHISKLFKLKSGLSPTEFRNIN